MIDEKIKNEILSKLPKIIEDWQKETVLTEPRKRWFRLTKWRHDPGNVHYLVSIIVGKDEQETFQMADELIEWHKKYTADQDDVSRTEDYTVKKY